MDQVRFVVADIVDFKLLLVNTSRFNVRQMSIADSSSFRLALGTFGLLAAAAFLPAEACTSLTIKTSDGGTVYGRTMEFGFDLKSEVTVIPRGRVNAGTTASGKPGKQWTSKYGIVGMNALGQEFVSDGLNEKGLAGGILYFPGYAQYTAPADAAPIKTLAPWEFLTWALGTCATVEEVKAALDNVEVIGLKFPGPDFVPPFHYVLHDRSGQSIVIEPTGGKLKVFDNPYGVMTNSPTFDWHLTNLRNYVKLSPENAQPLKVAGQQIASFGEGSGWLGIPGDPTPPSRFIRALAFSMTSDPKPSGIQSVRLVEHIMNNFDIPFGSTRSGGSAHPDYTQWIAIADLDEAVYYVKTYENQTLQAIVLSDFDLDAKTILSVPISPALDAPKVQFR